MFFTFCLGKNWTVRRSYWYISYTNTHSNINLYSVLILSYLMLLWYKSKDFLALNSFNSFRFHFQWLLDHPIRWEILWFSRSVNAKKWIQHEKLVYFFLKKIEFYFVSRNPIKLTYYLNSFDSVFDYCDHNLNQVSKLNFITKINFDI
jgi:hypothetical protein